MYLLFCCLPVDLFFMGDPMEDFFGDIANRVLVFTALSIAILGFLVHIGAV